MPEYGRYSDNFIISDSPVKRKGIGTFHTVNRLRFRRYNMYADESEVIVNYGQESEAEEEYQEAESVKDV